MVSTEYDGPARSSSTSQARKAGTPAIASSTMRRRSAAGAMPSASLCGGHGRRHEADLVEPHRLAHLLGGAQVRQVDRVEGAAEEPDAAAAVAAPSGRTWPVPRTWYL